MKQESFKAGKAVYAVQIKEASKVTVARLVTAVEGFTLERAEIAIVGDVTKDDKGYWLTARGSGAKFSLVNREKKEEEEKAPDVTAAIDKIIADGGKTIRVKGELTEKEKVENNIVKLESTEIVKK